MQHIQTLAGLLAILPFRAIARAIPAPLAVRGLDADEAVVYSTEDSNVWEKRHGLDADEAVVYSTGDANVWEKRHGLDADEAVVYSTEDANVWE